MEAQLAASFKLAASYFTKKQIKFCYKSFKILNTQPLILLLSTPHAISPINQKADYH